MSETAQRRTVWKRLDGVERYVHEIARLLDIRRGGWWSGIEHDQDVLAVARTGIRGPTILQ